MQAGITSPEQFYAYVIGRSARAIEQQREDCACIPELPAEVDFTFVQEFFAEACARGWRFALLLDEFEKLTDGHIFGETFFNSLRALSTEPKVDVAWVTTSFRDLYDLGRQVGLGETSPFFNIFDPFPFYLNALSETEAKRLLIEPAAKMGDHFADQDVDSILSFAGRLPFALQLAASRLFRAHRDGMAGLVAQSKAREEFSAAMKKHFDHYWKQFTPAECQVLRRVAQASGLTREDHTPLKGLVDYGFVEEIKGDYRILGEALREYLAVK